ncbi:hypothetical protein PIB30_009564 [Stylosanthes scabra]|uniref:Ubiquitin-like protease family profile domain-containing protein n=1 Tax=Stylosanthes scabra TaxID=79078 RepID=A0ABU6Q591_9FABA|nr:hypothetical protein [Stylosanthes scabra]
MGPTRELTADEQKKIYNWVMKDSKEDGVQKEVIAKFHQCRNLFLLRMEFRYLKPRKWITSSIINWKIKEFNNSKLPRFTNEFYCVQYGILDTLLIDRNLIAYQTRGEYFGMNPNLGLDKEDFDKEKWQQDNVCHWYLYAFNIVKRNDVIGLNVFDDKRKMVDLYVGKIVEDMLKIVFPTYDRIGFGFQCCYAKVPKQPNNDDCSICMLKFMESWTEDSNIQEYNNEQLNDIRRKFVIEIATSRFNTHRIAAFQKSFELPQRRINQIGKRRRKLKRHLQHLAHKKLLRG